MNPGERHFWQELEDLATYEGRELNRKHLANKLNKFNFLERFISLLFLESPTGKSVRIDAVPEPCDGQRLRCRPVAGRLFPTGNKALKLDRIHLYDDENLIVLAAEAISLKEDIIECRLPDTAETRNSRSVRRHYCGELGVRAAFGGRSISGQLLDFNAATFRVAFTGFEKAPDIGCAPGDIVAVELCTEERRVYSERCTIMRNFQVDDRFELVLTPVETNIPILKPKKYRSERLVLTPLPDIVFKHPLTGKTNSFKVVEISGTGFAVTEKADRVVLLPGLCIPHAELRISSGFTMLCSLRVIHSSTRPDSRNHTCGLAFTDMTMSDHTRLSAHLQQARNPNTYISVWENQEDLWDFFFESGFIYPKKYAFLTRHQESIQRLYHKLYTGSFEIVRHFVYKDNGIIKGHIGLLRLYHTTWMMHHMAARGYGAEMPGLVVLNQIGSFLNDSYGLKSNLMEYGIVYYRPENKFPSRVFGGVARNAKNPKICSLDTFAYFHHEKSAPENAWEPTPSSLSMSAASGDDLRKLSDFYEHQSGGLMLDAFGLTAEKKSDDELTAAYKKAGLKRRRSLFALKKEGCLKAVIMAYASDMGLNMSNLNNCLHVWVVDTAGLSGLELRQALTKASAPFEEDLITVNLFPREAADALSIDYEKQYTLWTIAMKYSDHYFGYLKRLTRFFKH